MEKSEVVTRVVNVIVAQLGVHKDQVVPEAAFVKDLGADSLDTVELVMAFEEEFEIEIPDSAEEDLATVGQAIAYVVKALADQPIVVAG